MLDSSPPRPRADLNANDAGVSVIAVLLVRERYAYLPI